MGWLGGAGSRVLTGGGLVANGGSTVVTADAVVMAAAPADFRPATYSSSKIKKGADNAAPELTLVPNPDIAAELGRRKVPGQVLVAGFDDIPLARLVSPALTTMRIDIAALGARAVARLAARIAGTRAAFVQEGSGEQDSDDGTGTEEVVPHLVARATTTTETIWGNDR